MLPLALILLTPSLALAEPFAFVTNQYEGSVRIIDTATDVVVGEPIAIGDGPLAIALNPSGTRAYATSTMGDVSVIDTAAGEVIATIPLSFYAIGVAVTLDEKRVYVVTSFDESLWEIDAETNEVVGEKIRFGGGITLGPSYVALTPDGTRAYITDTGASAVSVVDLVARKPIGIIENAGGGPLGIVTSPDGKRVYVVNQGGEVAIIDTTTNAVDGDVIRRSRALFIGVAISPEGDRLYVPDARNGKLLIFDTEARAFLETDLDIGPSSDGIALTGDGKRAYTAGNDQVRAIDTVRQVVAPNSIGLRGGLRGIAIQPPAPCAGDCRRKGSVTIDDLVTAYLVSTGAKADFYCALVDADGDGEVTTAEITGAVDLALGGCGA